MGMSAEVRYQFYLFGMALLWGGGLCLAYDILRIFRRLIRHRGWIINGEDVLYWLAAAAVFYSLLFRYNQGEIDGSGWRFFIFFVDGHLKNEKIHIFLDWKH